MARFDGDAVGAARLRENQRLGRIIKASDVTARRIENVQIDPASNIALTGPLISGNNFLQFDASDFANHTIPPSGVFALDVAFTSGVGSPAPLPSRLG